jgi:antitoxin component YwqK of YwqJK toxin-antitoxin module
MENGNFIDKNGRIFQKEKYLDGAEIGVWKIFHEKNGNLHQIE